MTIALSPLAECHIQNMNLNDTDAQTIRSCIQNYAMPESCSEQVKWVVYRITQAIKSIFNCSDWGVAEQILRLRGKEELSTRGYQIDTPTTPLEKLLQTSCFTFQVSNKFLISTLKAHQENCSDAQQIENAHTQTSWNALILEAVKKMEQILARHPEYVEQFREENSEYAPII